MARGSLPLHLGVSLLLAAAACRDREPRAPAPAGPRRIVFEMRTTERTIDGCIAGAPGCSYIRFDYPVIVDAPALADLDAIAATVEDFLAAPLPDGEGPATVPGLIEGFLAEYRAQGAKEAATGEAWFFERKAFVLHQRLIVLSLSFAERYHLGGGRISDTVRLLNLDPRTGSALTLSDVLLPGALPGLTSMAEARFREDPRFVGPEIAFALTENFSIGDEGLTFYYNTGEVVPAELGPAEILLTYDEAGELLAPEYRHEPET
jgi:hypothetical protein